MRISDAAGAARAGLIGLLMLAGCQRAPQDPRAAAGTLAEGTPPEAGRIACAVGGAAFARDCTVERAAAAGGGQVLTVRHKDGGFRRLAMTADGGTITAADGAEPATIGKRTTDGLEIAIGGDRYCLPAGT